MAGLDIKLSTLHQTLSVDTIATELLVEKIPSLSISNRHCGFLMLLITFIGLEYIFIG